MKALDGSIEKWSKTGDEFMDDACDNCPLCKLYGGGGCLTCPIYKYTGHSRCNNTPYMDWLVHQHYNHWPVIFPINIVCSECDKLRKKELAFLKKVKRNCVVKGGK
jgi:hypothetical protein